jgi:hypothetical protein
MPSDWEGAFDRLIHIEVLDVGGRRRGVLAFSETYWSIVE